MKKNFVIIPSLMLCLISTAQEVQQNRTTNRIGSSSPSSQENRSFLNNLLRNADRTSTGTTSSSASGTLNVSNREVVSQSSETSGNASVFQIPNSNSTGQQPTSTNNGTNNADDFSSILNRNFTNTTGTTLSSVTGSLSVVNEEVVDQSLETEGNASGTLSSGENVIDTQESSIENVVSNGDEAAVDTNDTSSDSDSNFTSTTGSTSSSVSGSLTVANDEVVDQSLETEGNASGSLSSGDNLVDEQSSSSTTETTAPLRVVLFPNPARNFINLRLVGTTEISGFEIKSSEGLVVKSSSAVDASSTRVDISDLDSGMYTVCVFSGNQVKIERFFKR